MTSTHLLEHSFRHEYGKLVAVFSCRIGVRHLEAIEDAVQSALMTAVETWPIQGPPAQPSAWLFRVARNALMGELRQHASRRRILERMAAGGGLAEGEPTIAFARAISRLMARPPSAGSSARRRSDWATSWGSIP